MKQLDPTLVSTERQRFESEMFRKIVGQDEAIRVVSDVFQMFRIGLNPPNKPVANLLFLGPTGVGKTRVTEAMAETLFGNPNAVIKINCAEFQHSHEIAKLIGSPPGYLGHKETHPVITPESLAAYHTEKLKLSLLLFDEIEKSSDGLWQLLLGMMDKAILTLGDNRRVDLSSTIIFLTSNLGGREITELTTGESMGFPSGPVRKLETRITNITENAAKRKFTPEFMNRIDKLVTFRPLTASNLEKILTLELNRVQQRIIENQTKFVFRVSKSARDFLLKEGTDVKYGARHLRRSIEQHIVYPLSNLISTEQAVSGDTIAIDYLGGEMKFFREAAAIA